MPRLPLSADHWSVCTVLLLLCGCLMPSLNGPATVSSTPLGVPGRHPSYHTGRTLCLWYRRRHLSANVRARHRKADLFILEKLLPHVMESMVVARCGQQRHKTQGSGQAAAGDVSRKTGTDVHANTSIAGGTNQSLTSRTVMTGLDNPPDLSPAQIPSLNLSPFQIPRQNGTTNASIFYYVNPPTFYHQPGEHQPSNQISIKHDQNVLGNSGLSQGHDAVDVKGGHEKSPKKPAKTRRRKRFLFESPEHPFPPPLLSVLMGTATDPNTGQPLELGGDALTRLLVNSFTSFLPPGLQPQPGREPGELMQVMAPLWYLNMETAYMSPSTYRGGARRRNGQGYYGDAVPAGRRRRSVHQ